MSKVYMGLLRGLVGLQVPSRRKSCIEVEVGFWMALNATGQYPQECLRRGALEPVGRVELGGVRLAQVCRSRTGNDRRQPAGPSPLIFSAGLAWEFTPLPNHRVAELSRDLWPSTPRPCHQHPLAISHMALQPLGIHA